MPRIIASAQTMLATGRQEANKAQRDAQPITPSIVSIGAVAVAIIRSAPARGSANPGTLRIGFPPRQKPPDPQQGEFITPGRIFRMDRRVEGRGRTPEENGPPPPEGRTHPQAPFCLVLCRGLSTKVTRQQGV